jgi:hypothetical protein
MPTAIRRKGESGQGIQALRLADAPGGEGSPFAPTRSDCRQGGPTALALVSRGLGLDYAVQPSVPTRFNRTVLMRLGRIGHVTVAVLLEVGADPRIVRKR